jgi:hypothetical protein
MWANSVWGLSGLCVTLLLARLSMIWTTGHEWIGPWLLVGAAVCFVGSVCLLVAPCFVAFGKARRPAGGLAPDIRIHDAIDYIVNDSKTRLRKEPEGYPAAAGFLWHGEQHQDALDQIREAATLGKLKVWGRIQIAEPSSLTFDSIQREIPVSYWERGTLDGCGYCFHNTDHPQTARLGGQGEIPFYTHLSLCKSQLIALWPKKSWFARARRRIIRSPRLSYRNQVDGY